MEKIKPRALSGFPEFLPEDQSKLEKMTEILRRTYALYGFTALDTPVVEASEILLAKAGGETEKQIYRFIKGDSDLALRFDLTVPLAKYAALHYGRLNFPFRRYQIGKVFRGERAQRGRFREFCQADIDIIGDGSLDIVNEAEIPAIIYKTFESFGLKRFKIKINNRKVLNGFFSSLVSADRVEAIMRAIDKLDKIGRDKVGESLSEEGISEKTAGEKTGVARSSAEEAEGNRIQRSGRIAVYSDCRYRFPGQGAVRRNLGNRQTDRVRRRRLGGDGRRQTDAAGPRTERACVFVSGPERLATIPGRLLQ